MQKFINFEGIYLVPDKVCAVGKVESIALGKTSCAWEFGFKIYLDGNIITYRKPDPRYSYYNSNTIDDYKDYIEGKRDKLIELLVGGGN